MTRYAVALGSNLGDRRGHLTTAVAEIGEFADVLRVSSLYETEPVGGPVQDRYLNAVAIIETDATPEELLVALQATEAAHGRGREVRWGPRTLDLDIVATDGEPVTTGSLVIPHPRSGQRRFVLEPLAELWPEAVVSGGTTAVEALAHVMDQNVERLEEL